MNIVRLTQGSPEWHAHRLNYFNASDAPAMMGCSPYKTRAALIRELATGLGETVTPEKQRLFDAGHRFEALARPLAEQVIGEELSPVVATRDKFSASFDGITFMGDVIFEHKTLNDDLRAAMTTMDGAALPLQYRVQMEQQLLVSGADKCLFMATKWTGDELAERREAWYLPDHELRAQIVAGWAQLEKDVAAFKPAEVVAELVADPVELLPAVVVKVSGELSVIANLGAFETKLRDFLDNRLIRKPKTDQDFVNLDLQIKAMKTGREAIKSAKAQALAQVEPVDVFSKTADMLDDLLQKNCAMAEKLLKDEKERRKTDIVMERQAALREHCDTLTKRVGVLVTAAADFGGVIKGLKSLASMEDKLDTELARAKIAASSLADLIDGNRKAMEAADAAGLFPDFSQVCTKPADDFANLIAGRRAAAEQRLQAERERIRAEEAAKLEAKQKAEAEAKAREEAAAQAQRDADARAEQQRQADAAEVERRRNAATIGHPDYQPLPVESIAAAVAAQSRGTAPAPEVRAFVAPAVAELPTMTLGQLSTRLGFTVTADFLAGLGFEAHKEKASRLYRPSLFPAICAAISAHVLLLASEAKKAA